MKIQRDFGTDTDWTRSRVADGGFKFAPAGHDHFFDVNQDGQRSMKRQ